MQPLIKLENVTKIYQLAHQQYTALDHIQFELMQGEMAAIVGASGSGKSTLMNLIGFLDQCTTGNYFFNGTNVSYLSSDELATIRNQKIGFVFQSFFLLPRLSVLENVMLPLFYRSESRTIAREKALSILEKVQMHTFIKHKPNQLSGGQQQRVAIARALVTDPDIILADEPTGALDTKTGREVMALFHELHKQDARTILIITHDKEVSSECEREITIRDGKIIAND